MFLSLIAALALNAPQAPTSSQPAAPRYYFILFGCQSIPYQPRTAHTFATFVKAMPTADGQTLVEPVTISWLPASGPVQPLRAQSVPGHNYSLEETFAIAARDNSRVSMWGPFETDAMRYEMAVSQANTLNSGAVRFRSVDSFTRNRSVQNCVHAVTYADPKLQSLRQPILVGYGEPGTGRLAAKYVNSGAFIGNETHDWLIPALGLDKVPVIRREPGERIPRER
jgi:hypothetical protein